MQLQVVLLSNKRTISLRWNSFHFGLTLLGLGMHPNLSGKIWPTWLHFLYEIPSPSYPSAADEWVGGRLVPPSRTYYRVEQLQEIHNWPICCWHIWFVKELLWLVLWLVVIALLWLVHPVLWPVHPVLWPVHPVLWLAIIVLLSLVPRPLPPEKRPGTHCLRMRKIFRYLFRKKLRALPCPYAEDYLTKNTELSLN